MDKFEVVIEETAVDAPDQQTFELSLIEMDMVGGGSSGMIIA